MKSKLKTWLIFAAVTCVGLLLAGYLSRDFWSKRFRVYIVGLDEAGAKEPRIQLSDLEGIRFTSVDVMDLYDSTFSESIQQRYAATGRAVLSAADAEKVRVHMIGAAELRAEECGFYLPDVDEIEVMALGDEDSSAPRDDPEHISHWKITGRRVLSGSEAEQIARLWREVPRAKHESSACHWPGYALRFRRNESLLLETTVCWYCHNYTIPIFGGRLSYGFEAESEPAKALLSLLQSHVPLSEKRKDQKR